MITTTTPTIQGKEIIEYKGIVFGEVVAGVDFIKILQQDLLNFFGGRSDPMKESLSKQERMLYEKWNQEQ